jgi:flagellar basal body-associated protein FliL
VEKKPAEPETPESPAPEAADLADLGDESFDVDISQEFPDFLAGESNEAALETPRIKDLLGSPDLPSRFMTFLSLAFAFLAVACFGLLLTVYVKYRHQLPKAVVVVAPLPKAMGEQTFSESIGSFDLFLKGERKQNDGHLEVDIVAECSTKEVCAIVKEHTDEARDRVNPILSNSSREDLLNPDTKTAIRHRMADQLNLMPAVLEKDQGKVIQVFFNNMTIEDGK